MIINTIDEALEAINWLHLANVIAIDTETDPIIPGKVPNVCGISVYTVVDHIPLSYYFVVNHKSLSPLLMDPVNLPTEEFYPAFNKLTSDGSKEWVLQNAAFDLPVLEKVGVSITGRVHDTMIYAHLVDENRRIGLAKLSDEYFGKDEAQFQDKIKRVAKKYDDNFSLIPPEFLGVYAEEDARLTWMLYWELIKEIGEQEMTHLLADEMEFLHVLRHMRARGVKINVQECRKLAQVGRLRQKEILAELGFDPGKPAELERKLFATPPEGLGFRPVEFGKRRSALFAPGMPKMPASLLKSYKHPLTDRVVEYRGHVKAVSTWFEAFANLADENGRLHPQYNQAPRPDTGQGGTVTGRLSCSNPNLQQIPRTSEDEVVQGVSKSKVKGLFITDEDWKLYSFDFSQLELRLAACYGLDKEMVEVFKSNGDMHQLTADKVGTDRYSAKTLNFAILYGAGPSKLAVLLGISEEEAREILQTFWRSFPGLGKIKWEAFQAATSRGWVRLWTGRRRHFPDPNFAHKAFNSIIQGGGGEIVKHAMLRVSRLPGYRDTFHMVNQVHDDVWIEIRKDSLDQIPDIRRELEWATTKFNVPFPVDQKIMA